MSLFCSKPFSFQLAGNSIGWASSIDRFAWLMAHEFLHKFNPTAENLSYLQNLAAKDSFYQKAYDRIYGEFYEGKEEEFVEAAARFMLLKLGFANHVRNLRSMKFLYYSPRTNSGGVPLAAIIYEELLNATIQENGFDYNTFIGDLFESGKIKPGSLEMAYQQAIKPVSGMAGMTINEHPNGAIINRIFENYPADQAELIAGDIICEINAVDLAGKDREEILDLLAGEKGRIIDLLLRRDSAIIKKRLVLQ